MRFVAAGDLHVGAGTDLSPDGADGRLLEQELVLRQIVDAANELEAPLLWAGDAWERRKPSPAEILVVRRQFARLQHGAIVIPGNHDVEAFERPTGYDLLDPMMGDGVGWYLTIARAPWIVGGHDYEVACLPWAPPTRLVAIEDGDRDTVNQRLADGLLDIARGLFARMHSGGPRILLGHWSVSGAALPAGLPTDQLREPVIDLAGLAEIGFDAVVLGHIHRPQLLSAADAPPIFYVGSPMPLNFGETTTEHGCWLLDTEAGAFQIPIESTPLQTIDTEAIDIGGEVALTHRPVEAGAVVKLRIKATPEQARRLDLARTRDDLLEMGARHVWAIQVEVARAAIAAGAPLVDEAIDDVEALRLWLEQTGYTGDKAGPRDRHAEYVRART